MASNGSANGSGLTHDVDVRALLADAEPPYAPPPQVAELGASCVRFVQSSTGVALDFTADTLGLLDHYVREARHGLSDRPEAAELLQAAIGAYFGEVVRQAFGGFWFAEGEHDGWRVSLSRVFLSFNPLAVAREALLTKAGSDWNAQVSVEPNQRRAVEERLARMPPVDEDEYYDLSTRFDVIFAVVELLSTRMAEAGHEDVRFTEDDYGRV